MPSPRGPDDPVRLRRRLVRTWVVLAVVVAGIVAAGRSYDTWPLSAWPVYSRARAVVPGPTTTELEVVATTASGAAVHLRDDELLEYSRAQIATDAIVAAVDDPGGETRRFLARLVDGAVDDDVVRLEIWEVTWTVDPTAVPPVDPDDPTASRRLVAFDPSGREVGGPVVDGPVVDGPVLDR